MNWFGRLVSVFWLALFVAVIGTYTVANAQTVAINWEDYDGAGLTDRATFPAPASPFVVTDPGTGITSTFSGTFITDGGATSGATLSDFVTFDQRSFGGPTGNVFFALDNSTLDYDDRVIFNMSFSEPVTALNFDVLNLTAGGDAVQILFDDGTGVERNIVNAPAVIATPGLGIVRYTAGGTDGYRGTLGGNPDLDVNFGAQQVVSVRVEFFTGPGALINPAELLSGLGDVTFAQVPPPITQADLSLVLSPATASPVTGSNTFVDVTITNRGGGGATGVTADFVLPSGLTYVSDDSGGAYNSSTGVWTVPGTLAANSSAQLRVVANVAGSGALILDSEVTASSLPDPDSAPNNNVLAEDDQDRVTLTPRAEPPPLFCLGRPITPLAFVNPIGETPGSDPNAPQLGDVFRFAGVAPGIDALVTVTAFNGGGSLLTIDNPTDGVPDNFQPTLLGPAGEASVDFEITVVTAGTSTPGELDFAGSAIDVDGNGTGNGLREYVEVSANIVEYALNDPTELDINASGPSAGNRVRFESRSDANAPGISVDNPENIVTAFFTDVTTFQYRIGKFGVAAGTGRLNSLAFNCPTITPSETTTNTASDEDFGDAPAGYGNPIHVISSGIQLGATNTAETSPGNSATASTDAGDDGVTLPASFQGGVAATVSIDARGAGGFLQGFFDWNRDGDFADTGEQAIVNVSDNDADQNTPISISVTPPIDAVAGASFARFRWATASDLGIEDPTGSGEVEDYQITIVGPVLSFTKTASSSDVIEGTNVTFTMTATETAGFDTSNLVVTDVVPAGLTVVSVANGGIESGGTITWSLAGPLNASGTPSASVSFVARADPVVADTPISNTASVMSDEVSLLISDTATINVLESPQVTCPVGSSSTGSGFASSGTGIFRSRIYWFDWSCGTTLVFLTGNTITKTWTLPDGIVVTGVISGITADLRPYDTTSNASNLFNDLYGGVNPIGLQSVTANIGADFDISYSATQGGAQIDLEYVAVDAETTSPGEALTVSTTGTDFTLIENAGGSAVSGTGSSSVVFTGDGTPGTSLVTSSGAPVFSNQLNQIVFQALGFGVRLALPDAELEGLKTVDVFDPADEGLFALPGNDVIYTLTVSNVADGPADANTIFLVDALPPEVSFFNGDVDGPGPETDPVAFQEIETTGLDPFVFANDVGFATGATQPESFNDCSYSPAPGYDPAVTFICFNPKGVMQAGDPDPAFAVSFRARIR